MDLKKLADVLRADDLEAQYFAADAEFDADRVDVSVHTDGFDEPLIIQITEPPVAEGSVGVLELIQLYAGIPVELEEGEIAWLVYGVQRANELSPLVGFCVHEAGSILYFRTVLPVLKGDAGIGVVNEGVWLTAFALDLHAANLIQGAREESD